MAKKAKPAAKSAPPPPGGTGVINTETASRLLECTSEWIRRLTREGWIKEQSKGQYTVVDLVQGYTRYLKDENRRTSKSAAASRLQDERAKEIEQRRLRDGNQLIDIGDVEAEWFEIMSTLRSELNGCPAAVSREMEVRRVIDDYITGALDRADKRFGKAKSAAFADTEGSLEEEAPAS